MLDWSKRMVQKKLKLNFSSLKIQRSLSNMVNQTQTSNQQVQEAKQILLFDFKSLADSQKNQSIQSSQKIQDETSSPQKNSCKQQQFQQKDQKSQDFLHFIQSICLYGPKQSNLQQSTINQTHIQNSLLYISHPSLKTQYQMYSSQFYTDQGIPIRRLKQRQISIYTDQIIVRKNTKRIDCSVVLFRAQQTNQKIYIKNQILQKVNAVKKLAAFFVQFTDYIYVENQQQNVQNINKSMQNVKKQKVEQKNKAQQSIQTTRETQITSKKKYCFKTKYTLCIFTYFPFINVMQQLLTSLMDQIKIRRVQAYAMKNIAEEVSVKYFINQLSKIII